MTSIILKKLSVVIVLLLIIPFKSIFASEQVLPHVFIINQVRGEECCSPGSIENLKLQLDTAVELSLPAYYTLRYDAINDPRYSSLVNEYFQNFPKHVKLGIFLEVTPQLAEDSGIQYNSPYDRWYEAQNAYSIGYTDAENKQIMDTLFEAFKEEFGFYPDLTTAWMIDSRTLEYIHTTYGVDVHQITREQWGTDSYTLYGGPPHYPYPARKDWVFLPDYGRQDAPLIVRQTITDPVFNYGDQTNAFTSQPNDYALDGKTTEYFKKLVNQALFGQPHRGFGLIGLENSMNLEHQEEYVRQLTYIGELKNDGRIIIPTSNELQDAWKNKTISMYTGIDQIHSTGQTAYWISTGNYRIRMIAQDNTLYISDIRLYDSSFQDPYLTYEGQKEGFWVVPFLLDTSIKVEYQDNAILYQRTQDTHKNLPVLYVSGIMAGSSVEWKESGDSLQMIFTNEKGVPVTIIFYQDSFEFDQVKRDDFQIVNLPPDYPVKFWQSNREVHLSWKSSLPFISLKIDCKEAECVGTFNKHEEKLTVLRKSHYIHLFPEPINHPIDPERTSIRLNNRYAVAGRNPVRFVITPYDEFGNPTTLPLEKLNYKSEEDLTHEKSTYNNIYFIDFYTENPSSSTVSINIDDHSLFNGRIFFAPNCKQDPQICITKPSHGVWYVQSYIGDKIRELKEYLNRKDIEGKNK